LSNLDATFRSDLPFPINQVWVWKGDKQDWWKDPSLIVQRIHCHDQLILGTEGCGEYWALIVSGQSYGTIWNISDVGASPCAPPKSFLEWYEHWIDLLDNQ